MKPRYALLALPLALAACDARSLADFRMPWDKPEAVAPAAPARPGIPEPTGASPLEQPLEVAGRQTRVATAQAATIDVTDVAAAGEGWSVTVRGDSARFERPGAKAANVAVRRIVYARGLEYVGVLNGKPFTLNVSAQSCGGQPLSAVLRANGNRHAGCATPLAPLPATARKAAPAKPAAQAAKKKPAATPARAPAPAPAKPAAPATPPPAEPAPAPTPAPVTTPAPTPAAEP
ncbi:MAG TPA: hypothetical protein PLL33_14115, partial [Paracoccus sp. (in: a-proteobacteria)]|nr:hypothetical protein [Paracoccus sp. (in: a-proteobacteria)]